MGGRDFRDFERGGGGGKTKFWIHRYTKGSGNT